MSAPVTARRCMGDARVRALTGARFLPPHLVVTFADGTVAGLPVDRIDHGFVLSQRPEWSRVRAAAHEVLVPTATGEVGLPWDHIRALTDPDFAAYWAEQTASIAARNAERLRALRAERRLEVEEVAQLAGLSGATVAGLEAGRQPIDLALVNRVLAAMDCTSDDLVAGSPPIAG